jgi:hypothetical protein
VPDHRLKALAIARAVEEAMNLDNAQEAVLTLLRRNIFQRFSLD